MPSVRPSGGRERRVLAGTIGPLTADPELLAKAIHEDYLRRGLANGRTPDEDPALVPWDSLPAGLQASNLSQATDIEHKLETVSRSVTTMIVPSPITELTTEEVELLGRMEHDRWVNERLDAGWSFGPTKDIGAKKSPYLVPWEQLTEEIRDLDRDTVRKIPEFLAQLGYAVGPPGSAD